MFWSHPLLPLICVSSPNIMNRMTSHPSSRRAILFIILGLKTQITGGNGRDQIICSKAANIPYSKSWSTRISILKNRGEKCVWYLPVGYSRWGFAAQHWPGFPQLAHSPAPSPVCAACLTKIHITTILKVRSHGAPGALHYSHSQRHYHSALALWA